VSYRLFERAVEDRLRQLAGRAQQTLESALVQKDFTTFLVKVIQARSALNTIIDEAIMLCLVKTLSAEKKGGR